MKPSHWLIFGTVALMLSGMGYVTWPGAKWIITAFVGGTAYGVGLTQIWWKGPQNDL